MARELVSNYGGRPDEEGREYKYLYCTSYNTTMLWNDQGSFDVSYGKKVIGPDVRIQTELRLHLAVLFGVHRFASFSVPISFLRLNFSLRASPSVPPGPCTSPLQLLYHRNCFVNIILLLFFFFSCQLASLYVSV